MEFPKQLKDQVYITSGNKFNDLCSLNTLLTSKIVSCWDQYNEKKEGGIR